ncbi:hypothetical protein B0H19DRAFT_1253605 [Mycena capillaripes]|nr:hypothetical protein B0H19DRAFT_1253605 [Mycena capillaripes]
MSCAPPTPPEPRQLPLAKDFADDATVVSAAQLASPSLYITIDEIAAATTAYLDISSGYPDMVVLPSSHSLLAELQITSWPTYLSGELRPGDFFLMWSNGKHFAGSKFAFGGSEVPLTEGEISYNNGMFENTNKAAVHITGLGLVADYYGRYGWIGQSITDHQFAMCAELARRLYRFLPAVTRPISPAPYSSWPSSTPLAIRAPLRRPFSLLPPRVPTPPALRQLQPITTSNSLMFIIPLAFWLLLPARCAAFTCRCRPRFARP